jgi:hypothetical protein
MNAQINVAALLLTLVAAMVAPAQSYTLDWSTIDGGGGSSTSGVYSVSGTIGQSDVGQMSGGKFSVDGGFWGVIAIVPTPGAPSLTIARATTNSIVISWPSPSNGWTLQQNGNVNSADWTDVLRAPADDWTNKSVTVLPTLNNVFYRLRKQ